MSFESNYRKNITESDINKFIFINGLLGKITDLKNGDLYMIPYEKTFYKKIIVDTENDTSKIFYKYSSIEMNTIKINNIYDKLFFVIDKFTFENIFSTIKYKEEADILNEIIENDEIAARQIFKVHLMASLTNYIKEKDSLSELETKQKKNEFKKQFQIYGPIELKMYILDIVCKWKFNESHYKLLDNAINEIYESTSTRKQKHQKKRNINEFKKILTA